MTQANVPQRFNKRTVLILAGGTGGHIMPGLAVASEMFDRGWNVTWAGNPNAMEGKLVPQYGLPLEPMTFTGVRGKGVMRWLTLPFVLLGAFKQAYQLISRVKPHVVLGMGGYVAFPCGVMAALRGIPLVIHEQNAIAGLTNKVLSWFAKRTLSAFPTNLRSTVVGNPVREAVCAVPAPEQRFTNRTGPLQLLVVGGSLGAQALNEVVPQAIKLLPEHDRPQVTHQAGEKHIDQLRANYGGAHVAATCVAFIDDMASAYAQADMVICRAGATTVAEVAAVGVPALFVPYPHAVDDHQTANAQFLVKHGAAEVRAQSELSAEWLALWLRRQNRQALLSTALKARAQGQADAAKVVANHCEQVAKPQTQQEGAA